VVCQIGGRVLASLAILAAVLAVGGSARADDGKKPIRFAPGATSAELSGSVLRGERDLYAIEARRGQTMTLHISAPEKNAVFQLYRPGAKLTPGESGSDVTGDTLPGAGEEDDATRWTGKLPQTGRYLIVVGARGGMRLTL